MPAKILNRAVAGTYAETFPFVPTFQVNQGDIANGATARLILGGNQTLYTSSDQGANYNSVGGIAANSPSAVANLTAQVKAIAFGAKTNTNVCYVSLTDGNIAVTTNITVVGGGFTVTKFKTAAGGTPVGTEVAQDLVIDPNDASTLYVVTETRVFETNDGGNTWTNLTDNLGSLFLPGFPQFVTNGRERSIALFNNGTATKADDVLVVGFPGGTFRRPLTTTGLPPGQTWSLFGANLPHTLVPSLVYDNLSDTLLAGTFGRGAWTINNATTALTNPGNAVEGASQTFNLGSFSDASPGPWLVDVNWGDGTLHTTFAAAAPGSLGTRSHTFPEEGNYTVTVTVTNLVNPSSDSQSFQVAVSDPAVVQGPAVAVSADEGAAFTGKALAQFTDPGGAEPNPSDNVDGIASHYKVVSIDWGDSTP